MSKSEEHILFLMLVSLMESLMFAGHVNADYPGNRFLVFDGVDDHVGFSGLEAQQFTIEFWAKPNHPIEAGSDSTYGHEYGFVISIGVGVCTYFDYKYGDFRVQLYHKRLGTSATYVAEYKGATQIWNTSWYHIAISYDGSTLRCYVNTTIDTLATVNPYYDSIFYDSPDGLIGTAINVASRAFGGSIDEIRYWNVSRSRTEIAEAFSRVLNETEINASSLVGYWQLDDGPNATSCQDYSLRKIDAQLGASPSTPSWMEDGAPIPPITPEFPSFLVLPLFMTATLLTIMLYKRKREKRHDGAAPPENSQFWRSIKPQAELEAHAQ